MGRSVEVASKAVAVAYKDTCYIGYRDYDEDGNEIILEEYDPCIGEHEWDFLVEDTVQQVKDAWPSFEDVSQDNKWIEYPYRETRIIAENTFAYVTISEYCGCTAITLIPKESDGWYPDEIRNDNLAIGFCNRIAKKFEEMFSDIRRIGSFSNGEVVFQRA